MWYLSLNNKKGMGMVEVIMAILLTSVGVIGVMTIQPQALKTAARSDYMGRAANLLYGQIQTYEYAIMNPESQVPSDFTFDDEVFPSGGGDNKIDADINFTVSRRIVKITSDPDSWRFTVTVSWPPLNETGITESIVVTKQDRFKDKMSE